ncbi:hypothetical protein LOC68_26865 [Blastopirellula sp. JC732]|uniref:Uncharacterized protein n=1 Tax=Blastopirellula sediminis TaxID=2894196 RepID=A0A9X1MSG2_9BACT|nr:hypothetical protein [Blastopirellula sediminis]MCC9604671.1 hypothetical protein [Blastopirellula sediminis]MCC9632031.1 hypothetical protein [Blastopirellula sediminis]
MSRSLPHVRCPECGADNNAFAANCWICQRPLVDEAELVKALPVEAPAFVAGVNTKVGNVLLLFTLIALILVGIGVSTVEPVALIFYAILVVAPCLGVGITLRQILVAKDKPTATGGLTAVLIVVSVVGLLMISFGILCFTACLQMFSPNAFH